MNAFPNNMFQFNPSPFINPNMNNMNNNINFFHNLINNQFPMMPMMNNNPMMQMNQMMMQNVNNQNNNNNAFNMNQNQKHSVDKIIDFYQKSGRKYMDYFEPNQIRQLLNNLDTNSPLLKEGNDIDDPLPYVNEKKN